MSDDYNPYQAPNSDVATNKDEAVTLSNEKKYTNTMLQHLKDTKPWVRLISVVMFIGIGFMILGGIAIMFSSSLVNSSVYGGIGAGFALGMGFLYIILSGLYIIPAVFLNRYATSLKDLMSTGKTQFMEDALKHQKSFWKFMGILTAIGLGIAALSIIIGIIVTIVTIASR